MSKRRRGFPSESHVKRGERAFTTQPGWANIAKTFAQQTHQHRADGCYRDTKQQADSYLGYLGHDTALALIGTEGMNRSTFIRSPQTVPAVQRNVVALASLNYHATLAQILFNSPLSQLQKVATYKGAPIYRRSFASCGQVDKSMPRTVYGAEYQGYAVLGLLPSAIERVIDTAAGSAPSLASNRIIDRW